MTRARTTRKRRLSGGRGGYEPRVRILGRQQRVLELVCQGWSQTAIAAELGISQPAVSKILRRAEERLFDNCVNATTRLRAKHTLLLDHQVREALQAWGHSKQTGHTVKRQRKAHGAGQGDATTVEVVVTVAHGDPRFLEQARKAMADQRKVWGLDSPDSLPVPLAPVNPCAHLSDAEVDSHHDRVIRNLGYTKATPTEPAAALMHAVDGRDHTLTPQAIAEQRYAEELERRRRVREGGSS